MAVYRPLKVYAFDPTAGRLHGNHMTIQVPYEPLRRGPRGRLVEVIDYDSTNRRYYEPVDLDDDDLLIQGGLTPTETDPRFHQQMVYAVASKTIDNFRLALGREIVWDRRRKGATRDAGRPLRIFPHGVQEANAYYTPDLHALVFGYFAARGDDVGQNLPGQVVFSCLSHDIIAHETTHALVHDVRRHFMEPTGPDTLAFHEAFADIVALFQHFTFREALLDHLLRSGGVLHQPALPPQVAAAGAPTIQAEEPGRNLMVDLARQFGEAMGMRAALRGALGSPRDPTALDRATEPHERGAVLVAAVFDAFFSVYSARMADLLRIARPASPGEGLSLDLGNRLTAEATKTARQFVTMCIRALDYCPPVDITFGDFLRALVTADLEVVPDDDRGYREMLIGAFRARGIRPGDAASYSEDALVWDTPEGPGGRPLVCRGLDFDPLRRAAPDVMEANARILSVFGSTHRRALHLKPGPKVQAFSFHPVLRVTPDGDLKEQIVVELLQHEERSPDGRKGETIVYRGGTTLVLDATGAVRCAVYKRLESARRWESQREFWDRWTSTGAGTFRGPAGRPLRADFALLHRGL